MSTQGWGPSPEGGGGVTQYCELLTLRLWALQGKNWFQASVPLKIRSVTRVCEYRFNILIYALKVPMIYPLKKRLKTQSAFGHRNGWSLLSKLHFDNRRCRGDPTAPRCKGRAITIILGKLHPWLLFRRVFFAHWTRKAYELALNISRFHYIKNIGNVAVSSEQAGHLEANVILLQQLCRSQLFDTIYL